MAVLFQKNHNIVLDFINIYFYVFVTLFLLILHTFSKQNLFANSNFHTPVS